MGMTGNMTSIAGNPTGNGTLPMHNVLRGFLGTTAEPAYSVVGNLTAIAGNLTGMAGNLTGMAGNLTGMAGNLTVWRVT